VSLTESRSSYTLTKSRGNDMKDQGNRISLAGWVYKETMQGTLW